MSTYTLEGREHVGTPPKGCELSESPCIFCGATIRHYNDGGVGWCVGAIVGGVSKEYLYCDKPPCVQSEAAWDAEVWRCWCAASGFAYLENVGNVCHGCRCLRADAEPPPEDGEVWDYGDERT